MKNKRKIYSISVAVISAVLSVVCLLVLPERVTVNISFQAEKSYMSKYAALAFPFAVSLFSSKMYFSYGSIFRKEIKDGDLKSGIKYLIFSLLGIGLTLWILFGNL